MTNPADNTPWCRVCGMAPQVRGCTPERCADPEAKRAAERRIIDEAARIATGIGATPETLDAAMRDDLALATEVWHIGPDGKPDFHEVKMSDVKASPGPWRWWTNPRDTEDMPHLLDANGDEVCSFGDSAQYYPSEGSPPDDANGALIADAPAMLELLRRLEHAGGDDGPTFCRICDGVAPEHLNEAPGVPCRLGALLDKHGRKP